MRDADPGRVHFHRDRSPEQRDGHDEAMGVPEGEYDAFCTAQRSDLDVHMLAGLEERPGLDHQPGVDDALDRVDFGVGDREWTAVVTDDADHTRRGDNLAGDAARRAAEDVPPRTMPGRPS